MINKYVILLFEKQQQIMFYNLVIMEKNLFSRKIPNYKIHPNGYSYQSIELYVNLEILRYINLESSENYR